MQGLMQLAWAVLIVGLTYAPVVALLGLLNLRDRRESRLLGRVVKELPLREFGGRIAIHVRSALLSPRSVVTLDMRGCSRDDIWQAIARLSQRLPPAVRLLVDGIVDPECPAPVTLTIPNTRRLPCPPQPSAVAG